MMKQRQKPDAGSMHELVRDLPPLRSRPRVCEECGQNPADAPSRLCVGCDAYREHTEAF
jgi:hypothetical protein